MSAATKAKRYYLRNVTDHDVNTEFSIAVAYYGDLMYNDVNGITLTNVSFGLAKDKFYANTNYTYW